jgi:CheY-like chemotaxis protein
LLALAPADETAETLAAEPVSIAEKGETRAGCACVSEGPVATKTILLVDDDLSFTQFLSDLLISVGYRIIVAKHGAAAFVELEIAQPDLILVDVFMPVIDGITFCRLVRAKPATRHTPIIVISAMPDVQHTIPVSIAGFLTKPLDIDALLSLIVSISEQPAVDA